MEEKKPKKRKSRVKSFFIRAALSALVFAGAYLAKIYVPHASSYIKNEIDYSMDFTYITSDVKDFMMKFTPAP